MYCKVTQKSLFIYHTKLLVINVVYYKFILVQDWRLQKLKMYFESKERLREKYGRRGMKKHR